MKSETRGFFVVAKIGRCVEELFFFDILLAFLYEIILLMTEHAQNRYTRRDRM